MGAFTDLEMKRERSKRNKREREREDIECDHVASITRRYTIQQTISIDHRERAGNRRRRFCRKVFCVIVLPLACCETRLHFIPNTNPVFISPSRYSLFQQCCRIKVPRSSCCCWLAAGSLWCCSGQLSIHWTSDVSWALQQHAHLQTHIARQCLTIKSLAFIHLTLSLCVGSNFVLCCVCLSVCVCCLRIVTSSDFVAPAQTAFLAKILWQTNQRFIEREKSWAARSFMFSLSVGRAMREGHSTHTDATPIRSYFQSPV
jgi:hypothetical protein